MAIDVDAVEAEIAEIKELIDAANHDDAANGEPANGEPAKDEPAQKPADVDPMLINLEAKANADEAAALPLDGHVEPLNAQALALDANLLALDANVPAEPVVEPVAAVAEPQSLDFLKKEHVQRWLQETGFLDKFKASWLTPSSNDATLILDEESAESLRMQLYAKALVVLGQSGINEKDIQNECLPSALFNQILGTVIPWETDSIDGKEPVPAGTPALLTGHQIKFPLLLKADARKLHCYLMSRLNEVLSPTGLLELFTPKKLKPWDEFIATLPDLPEHLRGEDDYAPFSDQCMEEGSFYVHFSKKTRGLYYRVICDDFNDFVESLESMVAAYGDKVEVPEDMPMEDPNNPLNVYLQLSTHIMGEIRALQQALIVKFPTLCEILAQPTASEGYGEDPITRLGAPVLFFDQVAVPIEFDIPKLLYPETDTILVLDASGSMGVGEANTSRMGILKSPNGLEKALTELSKKPNQFLIFVRYQGDRGSNVTVRVKGSDLARVPINAETLPLILRALREIEPDGATPGIKGLRTALETLTKTWKGMENKADDKKADGDKKVEADVIVPKTNARMIVATDGVWNEVRKGNKEEVDPTKFPQFKKDLRELFRSLGLLPLNILGMDLDPNKPEAQFLRLIAALGEEGSQILFANKDKLGDEINYLMLAEQFRFLDSVRVSYSVAGNKLASLPVSPFFTNRVVGRTLFVPKEVIDAAAAAKVEDIDVDIEITYDDKTKATRQHKLSLLQLQSTLAGVVGTPLSDYDKKRMTDEWVNEQISANGVARRSHFNLLSGAEQFGIYSNIFIKAAEHPGMIEIFQTIQERMEQCAPDWVDERLCTIMKVQSPAEIEKKSKLEQYVYLNKIHEELKKMFLTKAPAAIFERMVPLWCDYQLSKASQTKEQKEFEALSAEKQLLALAAVLKIAERQNPNANGKEPTTEELVKRRAAELLKKKATALDVRWMQEALATAAEIVDYSHFVHAAPLKRYQAVLKVAGMVSDLGKDESLSNELNRLLMEVWLEATLCEQAGVNNKKEFLALPADKRIKVLRSDEVRGEAEALEHEIALAEIATLLKDACDVYYKKLVSENLMAAVGVSTLQAYEQQVDVFTKQAAIQRLKAALAILLPTEEDQKGALEYLQVKEQELWLDLRILTVCKDFGIKSRAAFLQQPTAIVCLILDKLKQQAVAERLEVVVKEITALVASVQKAEVDNWLNQQLGSALGLADSAPNASGSISELPNHALEALSADLRKEIFDNLENSAREQKDRVEVFITAVRVKREAVEREIIRKEQARRAAEALANASKHQNRGLQFAGPQAQQGNQINSAVAEAKARMQAAQMAAQQQAYVPPAAVQHGAVHHQAHYVPEPVPEGIEIGTVAIKPDAWYVKKSTILAEDLIYMDPAQINRLIAQGLEVEEKAVAALTAQRQGGHYRRRHHDKQKQAKEDNMHQIAAQLRKRKAEALAKAKQDKDKDKGPDNNDPDKDKGKAPGR